MYSKGYGTQSYWLLNTKKDEPTQHLVVVVKRISKSRGNTSVLEKYTTENITVTPFTLHIPTKTLPPQWMKAQRILLIAVALLQSPKVSETRNCMKNFRIPDCCMKLKLPIHRIIILKMQIKQDSIVPEETKLVLLLWNHRHDHRGKFNEKHRR